MYPPTYLSIYLSVCLSQLVAQLITGGDPGFNTAAASPWLDLRVVPKEAMFGDLEAQAHRRFIKTHLPVDCLPYNPSAKYIYLVRDGRGERERAGAQRGRTGRGRGPRVFNVFYRYLFSPM